MTKNKRWGKEFIDTRDWKQYQEELLKRYEIYLDLDWVESWGEELEEMNRGKKGAPYTYPKSMIEWQSLLVEKFTTRGAEAISRRLEGFGVLPKCNDHATIHRRVLKLDLTFDVPQGVEIHEGTDGSGFKMTNAGEYFKDKYGRNRRKFAKVIITATKDEILGVDVEVNERGAITEPEAGEKHIEGTIQEGGDVKKSYNDGAFDQRGFFNFLEQHGIESAIRIRSNATTKAKGSQRRKREVIKFKGRDFKQWSDEIGYGMRWPMTEGHFSAIKRGYGENSRGKKKGNILIELKRKVWIYNKVKQYGKKKITA